MSILASGQTFYAWAAPAPSGRHSRRMHNTDLLPGADAPRRVGDSLRSDSGVCAHIAKMRRKDFDGLGTGEIEIRSNYTLSLAGAACAVIGAASLII